MEEGAEVKWQVDTWRVGSAALQVASSSLLRTTTLAEVLEMGTHAYEVIYNIIYFLKQLKTVEKTTY